MALIWPIWGPCMSDQLEERGATVSATAVWRAPHHVGLGARAERLLVLEVRSARSAAPLTDRIRQSLVRRKARHVQAETPGELVCIDTFYFGNLKNLGEVWQLTACDAVSSYAMGKVLSADNAAEAVAFLRDAVVPEVENAPQQLWLALTDGSSELKGDLDQICRQLGVRHMRTKP